MGKCYQDLILNIKKKIAEIRTDVDDINGPMEILNSTHMLNENFLDELPEILRDRPMARQTFNGQDFSQFPLTLLNYEGYNLDLYFWNKANTSIHDHNFSGAFKVIKGIYFQTTFRFEKIKVYNDWLAQGDLNKIKSEKLIAGDVIGIKRGSDFIHETYHFEGECVTACLRSEARTGPLHSFFPPSLRLKSVPFDLKEIKMLDYIRFLMLTITENTETIRSLLSDFSNPILCQIIFSYNVPEWLKRVELRSIAMEVLQNRHQNEEWFPEIKRCLERQKIMNTKLGHLMT
jgi:hypothetical protein